MKEQKNELETGNESIQWISLQNNYTFIKPEELFYSKTLCKSPDAMKMCI